MKKSVLLGLLLAFAALLTLGTGCGGEAQADKVECKGCSMKVDKTDMQGDKCKKCAGTSEKEDGDKPATVACELDCSMQNVPAAIASKITLGGETKNACPGCKKRFDAADDDGKKELWGSK